MTEAETAATLYERIRRDSNYRMAPYRVVAFIAEMMKRDPFAILHAIGVARVADDDSKVSGECPDNPGQFTGRSVNRRFRRQSKSIT